MSAGNHAQGVAYHAGRLGIPATIVMPVTTPFTKVKHTRDFGATVILQGDDLVRSRCRGARASRSGRASPSSIPMTMPLVIAGQGTLALEMLEDVPQLDALIVPVGGGGLISGCAMAAKAIKPDIEIYGVQTRALSGDVRRAERRCAAARAGRARPSPKASRSSSRAR